MNQLRHVGIIMDGNGRWAQQASRPRFFGHIKGARVAKKIITECAKNKLEYLTLYTFSSENWLRPASEVSFLMKLLKRYLEKETQTLIRQNIRFFAIGQISKLPEEVIQVINNTIKATEHCTGMNLTFALSYSSKQEITLAAQKIAQKILKNEVTLEQINENLFSECLSSYPAPEIDLLIRTSGEKRLSNFMLWQSAYAELFFSNTLWPDFNESEFNEIVDQFYKRNRRYGNIFPLSQDNSQDAELSN